MMMTLDSSQEKFFQKHAWIPLFALGLLFVLNILAVALFFAGPEQFAVDTGVDWDEFAEAFPSVATAFVLEQRLAYLGLASLTLFALVIIYFGLRTGRRWAWFALWLLPATLALTAILLTLADQPGLGIIYAGITLVAAICLLLPTRKFFPKKRIEAVTE